MQRLAGPHGMLWTRSLMSIGWGRFLNEPLLLVQCCAVPEFLSNLCYAFHHSFLLRVSPGPQIHLFLNDQKK